ncbi:LysR substrate-binding domain-containing protein [Aquabacterium sp. OR-4]|uniref:LysR substrate-binding domain-containing protein n=1 Tax=Aquabacterium sp. OR-4 TaxID=2978127 RepID=UPI0028C5A7B1|nr:LysR substrate-binding domain-containing protein [Aquabacterium sp. OR-4]MDT7833849.1 LysR substrate-binding domain-containing protein [Aquabacterium sp. OR-4]
MSGTRSSPRGTGGTGGTGGPPAPSLRSLRAVAAVAAAGSLGGAARQLHLSPAAVSRAVQAAESELGQRLFERGALGMAPTTAGQLCVLRAERALALLREAAQGLRSRGAGPAVEALPRQVSDALMRALIARGEHASESAAAAALGLSQPSLNEALRRLTHLTRLPLTERTRQGWRLNEDGDWLQQRFRLVLAELRIGRDDLAGDGEREAGRPGATLVLGALPMAGEVLLPSAVGALLARRPGLGVVVKDGTYESLVQLLRQAEIDLLVGPLRGAGAAADLAETPLFTDRFVAVARRGHPALAGRRLTSLRRLASYPWIGPLAGTPAFQVFDRLFALAGLPPPRVTLRAHSTAVVRSLLRGSDHVTLMSPWQAQADVEAGLLAWASAPLPQSERVIGITQRRHALASSACAQVIAQLQATVAGGRAIGPP